MATASKYFGPEEESWNVGTCGRVGISLFGKALQVWSTFAAEECEDLNGISVQQAASTFHCDPEMIIEAVEDHPWMYLWSLDEEDENPAQIYIDHDGE